MLLCARTIGYILFLLLISWTFDFSPRFRQSKQGDRRRIRRDRHSFRLGSETIQEENTQRLGIETSISSRVEKKTATTVEAPRAIVTTTSTGQEQEDKRFEHVVVDLYYPEHQKIEKRMPVIDKKVVEVGLES